MAIFDNRRQRERERERESMCVRESLLRSSMCAQSITCERKGLRDLALVVCLFVRGERERTQIV